MLLHLAARRRTGVLLGCCATLAAVIAPSVAFAVPTITVRVSTTAMPNMGMHRTAIYTAPSCSSDRLVGGGSYLRNATNESTVPNNGLVLFGTMPTDSAGAPVATASTNPAYWTTLGGFSGQSEAGDQASAYAMCAASGPANTIVRTATTTGANATQQVAAPTITTATCTGTHRLVGGGVIQDTPGQVNDGTTSGNAGNLKPLASYPSDSSGVPASDSSSNPTSWSAYGSAGMPAGTDIITAFAVCSTDSSPPTITVKRTDTSGPDAQVGTTVTTATVSCGAGTRMLSGGYRVDETVGATSGLQPQQGYHMRGTYPVDGTGAASVDTASNPNTWKTVLQAGGQTLATGSHMDTKTFALCSA